MASLEQIQTTIDELIKKDKSNIDMMIKMDKMWNMDWTLPSKLRNLQWIRAVKTSDPHDSVRGATRMLAAVMPKLTITPLSHVESERDRMDEIERALMWQLNLAFKRRGKPLATLVRQALLYDRCVAQVIYLPHQQKAMDTFSPKSLRFKYAKRFGDFAVVPRDPKQVHAAWSDWGVERVVYRNVATINEIIDFWGEEVAKGLVKERRKKDVTGYEYASIFDYQDMEERKVYCIIQGKKDTISDPINDKPIVILESENKLEFLPWVIKDGGEELIPMLYSVAKTDQWEDQNIYETIGMSETIAKFAYPRIKKTGPGEVEIDAGEPGRTLDVPPGTDVEPFEPPRSDPDLVIFSDRLQARMSKSTIPNLLITGEFPAGSAFASLDLVTKGGAKSVTPYKELAEDAIEEIYRQMLYWIEYENGELVAYPTSRGQAQEITEPMTINADDYDVDALYMEVKLEPDIPLDQIQQYNAAVMANRDLNVALRDSLEKAGIHDPGATMDRWYEEQIRRRGFEREQSRLDMEMQSESQLRAQQQMMLLQMNAQQQMAAQQPQTPEGQYTQDEAQRRSGPAFQAARGQAANPAAGGSPASMFFPQGTREGQAQQRMPAEEETQLRGGF